MSKNEKNSKKMYSVKQIIMFISFIVLFIQLFIFVFISSEINIKKLLLEKDLNYFQEYNIIQKSKFENLFKNKFLINNKIEEVFNSIYSDAETFSLSNKIEDFNITDDMVKSVINLLNTSQATGAILILDENPTQVEKKNSLYLKKGNYVSSSNSNYSNLFAKAGEVDLIKNNRLSFDFDWKNKLDLSKDSDISFIYKKLYSIYENRTNKKDDVHYWYYLDNSYDTDNRILVYSLPIIIDNKFSGMLCIEYDTGFLLNEIFISGKNILNLKDRAYILAEKIENESNFDKSKYNIISFTGTDFDEIQSNKVITIDNENNLFMDNVYSVYFNKNPFIEYVVSIEPVELYNKKRENSNQFYSIYIIKADVLFNRSQRISQVIWVPIILSFVFSIVTLFGIGNLVSVQIKRLLDIVIELSTGNRKYIPTIYVKEVDELNRVINKLNRYIDDSTSKMQQVIENAGISIGIIEYDQETKLVSLVGNVKELLNFSEKVDNLRIIDHLTYKMEIQRFLSKTKIYLREIDSTNYNERIIYEFPIKLENSDVIENKYISVLTKKLNKKIYKIIQDETERINNMLKLEYDKEHDTLTKLYNREAFRSKVRKILDKKDLINGAMVMLDLDNLKYINDSYGHEEGDYYIRHTGEILESKSNLFSNIILGRMSGDEFFAFIYNFESKDEVLDKLYEIQEYLKNSYNSININDNLKIRSSISIAWYPDDSINVDELIRYSDFAMYTIKSTNKGSISEFNMNKYNNDYILIQGKEAINQLIDEKLVRFAFQPIVDVKTGEIFAYEALMRSTSSKLSSVYDIMRLAKSQSKLHSIEKLTWFCVLESYMEQRDKFRDKRLFINTIPNINLSEEDFKIIDEKYSEMLDKLVIEVIESEQIEENAINMKQKYKEKWNASIALDDFGAGYSTESAVLILNPDFIKIDMSIIRDIDTDRNRKKLVSNILDYTKHRNIKVIAEGVETTNELETLVKMGVDYIQGYYLAKPDFEVKDLDEQKVMELKKLNNANKELNI